MTVTFHAEWQFIRIYGEGIQPHTGRHWNCEPAWDVTAVYREPDGVVRHPDYHRARSGRPGQYPNRDAFVGVFWNRHIDRRFHVEYRLASRETPRVQGRTIGAPAREWDTLIEYRDRYLAEAGLSLSSPPLDIARALAETFACDSFLKKPTCSTFADEPRQLSHPIEGLLHRSYCTGCAQAFMALADACGLAVRGIGCGGHWVAEVRIGDKWRVADSVGRHEEYRGLACFFEASYMDMFLDPMGDHGVIPYDSFRDGLFRRPNPQFHLTSGAWSGPCTARWSAGVAYALYPDNARWGFKSDDGRRLPILARSGGFYWPVVHSSDAAALAAVRATSLPMPITEGGPSRDYLYHPFRPGQKLRQSVWLDTVDDMVEMELTLPFGASRATDFSEHVGRQVRLRVGDFERSLADLGAWPPTPPVAGGPENSPSTGNLVSRVRLEPGVFRPYAVNWIELCQQSGALLYVPCLPVALEPCIPALWSETEDPWRPPRPS